MAPNHDDLWSSTRDLFEEQVQLPIHFAVVDDTPILRRVAIKRLQVEQGQATSGCGKVQALVTWQRDGRGR